MLSVLNARYVTGNPQAEANEKAVQNKASGKAQFARYQAVLGTNAPKTIAEFQNIKYNEPEKWQSMNLDYSRRQDLIQNPEKALPNADSTIAPESKFTKYLFDPSSTKRWPKGQAFDSHLGYNATNWGELQRAIQENAKNYPATHKGNSGYGEQYEQKTVLYGKGGHQQMSLWVGL